MRAAYRVESIILMELHLSVFAVIKRHGAEYTVGMMDTASFYFQGTAVQHETVFSIHGNRPDAKESFSSIDYLCINALV